MVKWNDRVLVLGSTGSGKSELLNYLIAGLACQRFLLDSKDEWTVPAVDVVRNVDAIDWSGRTVHFRTAPDAGPDVYDGVFRACYYRRNLTVCVHELGDVCDYNAAKTPRWFNTYISKGRARGDGLFMGSQRPSTIPTRALGESEHVFMVGERFLVPADHAKVSEAMGQDPRELARLIDQVQEQLGVPDANGRTHAYLWFDRNRRRLTACPQLPDNHRAAIDVVRALEPGSSQAPEQAPDEELV